MGQNIKGTCDLVTMLFASDELAGIYKGGLAYQTSPQYNNNIMYSTRG